jgi:hypothetical protein
MSSTHCCEDSDSDSSQHDSSSFDEECRSASGTSASSTKATDEDAVGIKDQVISSKETAAVLRIRVVVIISLLLAAAAVSFVVYFIIRNAELEEFEIQYEGTAEKVLASFTDVVKEMGAISGLGIAASSHGFRTKNEWPFVTLSDFQQRAGNARTLSGTLYVSINPIVDTKETLDKWEEYVLGENNYW